MLSTRGSWTANCSKPPAKPPQQAALKSWTCSAALARASELAPHEDQGGDHRRVPQHRREIGQEKPPVAVEDRQRPDRQHQQAGHRKKNANPGHGEGEPVDRQLSSGHGRGVAQEARREQHDDRLGEQDPQQGETRRRGHHEAEDGAREAAGLLVPPLLQQAAVDGDERRRERSLAEQVLEHVGDAHGRGQRVLVRADAEIAGEHPLADEPHQPAGQDAGEDARRSGFRARALLRGLGRLLRDGRVDALRGIGHPAVHRGAHWGRSFQFSRAL